MLFTDGGEERARAILEKYNADKKVRIFTFSVGQHNYDKGPIQWMACSNKGYFYEIPSIGAIRINTQEYLDVLGRPMQLGLVITGTLPVFNKTKTKDDRNGEHQNQLILGVMGIDVSLDDIKKLTPRFTIGPNGYYFAIDPNGYVLLHPNLQPKIRRMMIDGETGERTINTLVKTQDERYIDRGVRTYTFAPVNGTDYSLALALPPYSEHFIQAKLGDNMKKAMSMETIQQESFDEFGYTYIAPRAYCKELKLSLNNTQFLLDFSQYIDRNTSDACNVSLVNRLILDAGLTAELVKLWNEQTVDGIVARFVATDGGITRVHPRSAGEEWTENPETYESSFYKRTLDNEIYIFTAPSFNPESREPVSDSGILVSKAVHITIDEVTLKPAVVGVKLNISFWMNSFINATMKQNCKDEICGCLRNDKIGQFFGEVDPVLMISLVNTYLYSFNKTYDYQSVCDPEKDGKAAAGPRSVYVPTIADLLSIGWWASSAAWSILQQLFFGLMFPNLLEAAESADDDIPDAMFKESCITEQTQLYRAEKLPNTNLVFLITDAKATCLSCDPRPLRQAEQPSSYKMSSSESVCAAEGPDPCELAQNPRYRKGPDVCFDNNENVRDNHTCLHAENIAGNSSISEASQLASVNSDEPLCPISRGSTLSPTPLLLFLALSAVKQALRAQCRNAAMSWDELVLCLNAVYAYGFPPDIPHDLFEGVVPVKLYILCK
ncbi:hypothetical protein FQN60_014126, partial [Etheostoma spectabile]